MEIMRLHPLAQCEIGRKSPGFLDSLFDLGFANRPCDRLGSELIERVVARVVLYDGHGSVGFGPDLFAVPIRSLWETNEVTHDRS